MPRRRTLRSSWPAASEPARHALAARQDIVSEADAGDGSFTQHEGPFADYRRTVDQRDGTTHQTVEYTLRIPGWTWIFGPLVDRQLRRTVRHGDRRPVWAPPERLHAPQVALLGLLAWASLSATFANTLFTQTATLAADTFFPNLDDTAGPVSRAGVVVRLGIIIALPFTLLADRVGRRRMLVLTAWLAPIVCSLGALAPNWTALVASQTVGRPIGIALAVLVGVMLAEEMPAGSRAFGVSLLAMAGGMGAAGAVGLLWLNDVVEEGWRLTYGAALLWLGVAVLLTRSLPETSRFNRAHARAEAPVQRAARESVGGGRLARFAMIASVAVLANLFVAPASFLQNDYLKDVRGFSGLGISVFTFATAMPSALALALGGRLADTLGRRRLLAVCMPASTALLVTSFSIGGPLMWMSALGGGLCAGLAYPAFIIYRAELFPTGARSGTNGVVMALSLAGSALGLWYVGHLVDRGWQYGSAMAIVAVGQFAAAAIAAIAYPETARRELEDLNPQDR